MFRLVACAAACGFLLACSTEVDSPFGGGPTTTMSAPAPSVTTETGHAAAPPPPAPSSASGADAPKANTTCSWGAVEAEPNDAASSATALLGGKACGSLSSAGDIDWFQLDTTYPTVVKLKVKADGDAVGTLIAPDGHAEDTKPGDDAAIFQLNPGHWTVRIRSASGTKQSYEITAEY